MRRATSSKTRNASASAAKTPSRARPKAEASPARASGEVAAFLKRVDAGRREDAAALSAMMARITGEKPRLWGSIVGFGRYHYRYDSGHEGDTCLVGFAPRKAAFSIYLTGTYFPEIGPRRDKLLARLGKHTMGKGCLYVKRLSGVDTDVLAELIDLSVSQLRERYPA